MSFQTRIATYHDYSAIVRLLLEVHNLHHNHRPDVYAEVDIPLTQEHYLAMLEQEHLQIFVIEESCSHEIIGYGSVKFLSLSSLSLLVPTHIAYIDDFCIASQFKRQGAGKFLFNTIAQYAKEMGAQSLQLTVWEFNKDALAFYSSPGMHTRNRRLELDLKGY